ncbi:hypothetical protein V8E55_003029 [Tylopilus felleus]
MHGLVLESLSLIRVFSSNMSPSRLSNGQYRISNFRFPYQEVDLLYASPSGAIGGFHRNFESYNMVVRFHSQRSTPASDLNQITLTSAAMPTTASVWVSFGGATIRPDRLDPHSDLLPSMLMRIAMPCLETCFLTHFVQRIFAPLTVNSTIPSDLAWSLPSGNDSTPVSHSSLTHAPFLNRIILCLLIRSKNADRARGIQLLR